MQRSDSNKALVTAVICSLRARILPQATATMSAENGLEDQPPTTGRHIELVTDGLKDSKIDENGTETSPVLTNGKGWDGKLRVPARVSLANPEALSDPEYSDDENVMEGEDIKPDEGDYLRSNSYRSAMCVKLASVDVSFAN